jgi:hypothetical protein
LAAAERSAAAVLCAVRTRWRRAERAADFLTRVPVLFDKSANHQELLTRIEASAKIAVATGATGQTRKRMDTLARPRRGCRS